MRKRLCIAVMVCSLWQMVSAQDSLKMHLQGIRERTDQVQIIRNDIYESPALRPFQYQQSMTPLDISYFNDNKDLYHDQVGSGQKGFRISTDSYQKQAFPNITLWGNAKYENFKIQDLRFNETSDYELLFPYLTADSIGGDLNTEVYAFSGGIAKEIGRWIIAGQAGYRANLSHRKIDPRPVNNSSDIKSGFGVSYAINPRYLLSTNIDLRFYKQRNQLSFVSVLGKPANYHFNGLGAFNSLISGSSETQGDVLYQLHAVGTKFTLAPRNEKGVFLQLGMDQTAGFRTLPLSTSHANDWKDQVISGKAGYLQNHQTWRYGISASLNLQTRKGVESLFNNDGTATGYVKISELSSYRYYQFDYQLETYIGQKDWSIKPYASYSQIKEQYINPFREQFANSINFGIQGQYLWELNQGLLGITLNLRQQKVLDNHSQFNQVVQGSGIAALLQQNYNYLIAEPFSIDGLVRYDFAQKKQIKPFVKAQAISASEINQQHFVLSFGIMF